MKLGTKFKTIIKIADKCIFIPLEKLQHSVIKILSLTINYINLQYFKKLNLKKLLFKLFIYITLFIISIYSLHYSKNYFPSYIYYPLFLLISVYIIYLLLKLKKDLVAVGFLSEYDIASEYNFITINQKIERLKSSINLYNEESKIKLRQKKYTKKILKGFNHLLKKQNEHISNEGINDLSSFIIESLFVNTSKLKYNNIKPVFDKVKFSHHCLIDYMLFLFNENYLEIEQETKIVKPLLKHFPIKYNRGFGEQNIYNRVSNNKNKKLKFSNITSETMLKNVIRN